MKRVLITGANRGIGLEFVRQYLAAGWQVYGTAREPEAAVDLKQLQEEAGDRLNILKVDLMDSRSIDILGRTMERLESKLELLINNAGTYGSKQSFTEMDTEEVLRVFRVNCLGTLQLTRRLFSFISSARGKIIFITSLMGSIADNRSGSAYAYRISKAALNMFGKTLSQDYQADGIYSLLLHPGWVRTRMGGENAKIDTTTSVSGMRRLIARLDREMSGGFYNYDGEKLPW